MQGQLHPTFSQSTPEVPVHSNMGRSADPRLGTPIPAPPQLNSSPPRPFRQSDIGLRGGACKHPSEKERRKGKPARNKLWQWRGARREPRGAEEDRGGCSQVRSGLGKLFDSVPRDPARKFLITRLKPEGGRDQGSRRRLALHLQPTRPYWVSETLGGGLGGGDLQRGRAEANTKPFPHPPPTHPQPRPSASWPSLPPPGRGILAPLRHRPAGHPRLRDLHQGREVRGGGIGDPTSSGENRVPVARCSAPMLCCLLRLGVENQPAGVLSGPTGSREVGGGWTGVSQGKSGR